MTSAISYSSALRGIYALDKFGSHLGLERIRRILLLLGSPQKSLRCIVVGGSNGKGSTVEMVGGMLQAGGFRVGTYFSPQIEEFPERIRINGKNASRGDIALAYVAVRAVCERNSIRATFFEVVTAMALLIFRHHRADFAVLEVGLGGRLDATNAVEPEISAITSVSLEHTDVLGKTIARIAREKCGIARKGRPLVCGILPKEAKKAAREECGHAGAKAIFTGDAVRVSELREDGGRFAFAASFAGKNYSISLAAPGKFQVGNACVALALCSLLGASKSAVETGLSRAEPKYRFQKISSSPLVIADCAHNPEAARALACEVRKIGAEKRVLLFSAMKDKDYPQVLGILAGLFDGIVVAEVSLKRAAGMRELEGAAKKVCAGRFAAGGTKRGHVLSVKSPKKALSAAKRLAGRKGAVVAAGSIYLLSEIFGRDKIRVAQ